MQRLKQDPAQAGGPGGAAEDINRLSDNYVITSPSPCQVLSPAHLIMLKTGSSIDDAVINARGYRTITDAKELAGLGFSPTQCRVPGLLLPLHTTDGGNGLYIYRPDVPRVVGKDGKAIKYEQPKGAGVRLDCPPSCRPALADPKIPLWITEGQKKADCLASRGLCTVALLGVWNFKGTNAHGGITYLADFDYIALNGRDVRIVFDSDVMTKPEVKKALDRLTEHMQRKKAHVSAVYLPPAQDGDKQGVDDFLAAGHTTQELEALVSAPHPAPQAAAPVVELLDAAPLAMRRPLALLDGHGYAATWLHVRVTVTETINKQGEIVKHDPPITTTEQRPFVLRDDGTVYGDGGDKTIDDLGLDVRLPEVPPVDRLWSAAGVRSFRSGQRPDPADVFRRVVETVSRFIDFDRSLADQNTMSELIACFLLSTWLSDAFTVLGNLWPNGDRGSGKTQLLVVICEMAYLGQVILSGGSFASLRDLADYGACLAFDDAEGMSDPRKTDPDKRALLLAGNRRGNTIPLKELIGERWVTRHVSTFCPRLFSATRLPDPILASRTIIVPLIRTPDRYRANADPLDYKLWPHDRRRLIDDLWPLALSNIARLPAFESDVNERANLTGRNLEPWRALLAVALWLDGCGVPGLWERMEALSLAYQSERPDLEYGDLTTLVIRALCANHANHANCANLHGEVEVTSSEIREAAIAIIQNDDSDIDEDFVTTKRVGMVLAKMRLKKPPRPGGKGRRKWLVTTNDLQRWTIAYGLPVPTQSNNPTPSLEVGTVGEVGMVGTGEREDIVL